MVVPPIESRRLALVAFSRPAMQAVLDGDLRAAEAELGATLPRDIRDRLGELFVVRLAEVDRDPDIVPWLARAMVLRDGGNNARVVGSVGFHGPPDADGRVEVGYHVEPGFRGRGFATEAVQSLIGWAASQHRVRRFRASISPENAPSLAVARRLGFRQTGVRWDEIDGQELVLELDLPEVGAAAMP
jgi:[ribosomal protein S5]-alanine N-acetyltransferase